MGVKDKINKEVTNSKTLIQEVAKISISKGSKKVLRVVNRLNNEVDVVEVRIIGVITKETKMMLTQNHKMHLKGQINLAGKTMITTITKDLLVKVTTKTDHIGRMKLIHNLDNSVEVEVVSKEVGVMTTAVVIVVEVDEEVVVDIVMILLEKQLIMIKNILQQTH